MTEVFQSSRNFEICVIESQLANKKAYLVLAVNTCCVSGGVAESRRSVQRGGAGMSASRRR